MRQESSDQVITHRKTLNSYFMGNITTCHPILEHDWIPNHFHLNVQWPPPLEQDKQGRAVEEGQHGVRDHLTSKVGQPPNPGNWHLPLPSPLTELEGKTKETYRIDKTDK